MLLRLFLSVARDLSQRNTPEMRRVILPMDAYSYRFAAIISLA